ncbi:MAG TPA: glycosyltransferase family 4 protein [Gemmatimonadales bacterium]|nr:glycosyltransferase family 4 protein [Gemmatimonadales bacterium]
MRITWSVPVPGEPLRGSRGDVVRARHLIEALRAEGHELCVVERAAAPATAATVATYRRVVRGLVPRGPALVLRDAGRWAEAWVHGRRVAAAALAQGADLIVETQVHFAGSGALAARTTGLPLLLDDCSPSSEERALGAGLPGLARRVFRTQVRAARHVVVSSRALRRCLTREGVPAEKLHVVPNGVDLTAYLRADRDAARRRLGLEAACVIGFAGSFQPWHRVDLLVEALALLGDEPAVHVLLLGDGPERPRALAAARSFGLDRRVIAPGAVPPEELPGWIAACDIGALPGSNDYGQPMKLMDYAAAGLPAVAPDLAPVREVVEDGVTGLLFAPGHGPALSRALARLIRDAALRRAMGARARRVAEGGSWRARAQQLVALVTQPRPSHGGTARGVTWIGAGLQNSGLQN